MSVAAVSSNLLNKDHTETKDGSSISNTNQQKKEFLWFESGVRFHLTNNRSGNGTAQAMPSPFVSKLRKHIRSQRLEKVAQFGSDRVVLFQFGVGSGTNQCSILLELYAKGNLVLVDHEYRILALLRSHVYRQPPTTISQTTPATNSNYGSTSKDTRSLLKSDDKNDEITDNSKNSNDNNKDQFSKQKTKDSANTTMLKESARNIAALVQVGQVYPVTYATSLEPTKKPTETNPSETGSVQDTVTSTKDSETLPASILDMAQPEQLRDWLTNVCDKIYSNTDEITGPVTPKKEKKANVTLKNALLRIDSGVSHYGPALIEHCIITAQLQPHQSVRQLLCPVGSTSNDNKNNFDSTDSDTVENYQKDKTIQSPWYQRLFLALKVEGKAVIDSLQEASHKDTPGYILYHMQSSPPPPRQTLGNREGIADPNNNLTNTSTLKDQTEDTNADPPIKILDEFVPHLLKQHEARMYDSFATFSDAVDEFFSNLARQKAMLRAHAAEASARSKLEKIKQDQQDRIRALEKEQEVMYQHAKIVQLHADNVDKALLVINSALSSDMEWNQLEQVLAVEKNQNKNPIALLIHRLDLENDAMILRLPSNVEDPTYTNNTHDNADKLDSDYTLPPSYVDVKILLKDTAHANASRLFAKYRSLKEKSQKTIEASSKALKAAEENTKRQLLEAQKRKPDLLHDHSSIYKRVYYWFEKFHWFITSDNYLVVGGRDAHQNELLVKRYLRPGDAYLHADVFGASSCILRAKRRRRTNLNDNDNKQKVEVVPLSDLALREAGNFTICHSSAWSSKVITSAWWVESHQVSKTAPTGEYLTVGAFMVRGKKNYLPPTSPLEMGLAILFRYSTDDEDAVARHKNERRDFALLSEHNDSEANIDKSLHETQNERNIGDESLRSNNNNNIGEDKFVTSQSHRVDNNDTTENLNTSPDPITIGVNNIDNNDMEIYDNTLNNSNPQLQQQEQGEALRSASYRDPLLSPDQEEDNENDEVEQGSNANGSVVDEYDGSRSVCHHDSLNVTLQQNEMNSSNDNKSVDQTKPQQQQKRGLSVRDRKLVKKYGSLREAQRILGECNDDHQQKQQKELSNKSAGAEEEEDEASLPKQQQATKSLTQLPQPAVKNTTTRGKKAKEKRALKKYADQDEDDRKIALLALQGGEKIKAKKSEKAATTKTGSNKKGTKLAATVKQQEEVAAATALLLVKDTATVAARLHPDVQQILINCMKKCEQNNNDIQENVTLSIRSSTNVSTSHPVDKQGRKAFTADKKNKSTDVAASDNRDVVQWNQLDSDVLEQLIRLEPFEAQVAAAKRLLDLMQSTKIDNISASLGGIIRTIRKYGHVGRDKESQTLQRGDDQELVTKKILHAKKDKQVTGPLGSDVTGQEDGDVDDHSIAVDDTLELVNLTGKPHPEDLLLFGVPVCGPYSSLQQYTYRVKLTPGNLKRGKAAKQCVELFLKAAVSENGKSTSNPSGVCRQQLETIKRVPEQDWVQAICADTKISAAGAGKIAKSINNNKSKAKSKK